MGASRIRPLTIKEIEKLTASKPNTIKHRFLGGVPGFVLVHTPAGHTSYGLIYRVGSQRRKLTLGTTKMLTLGEARSLAGKHRAAIESGADPQGEKVAERERIETERREAEDNEKLDVETLWEKYMHLVASQLRSRAEKDRVFRRYIMPVIGGLSVTEVEKRHALDIIDRLVAEDKRRMADKVRQEGAAFFEWLIEREHVERNVFARIRKACVKKTVRTRVLSDEEVRAIWWAAEPEGNWADWIRLLILTGCRNMEVRGARWSEFDLVQRVWTIPAERYKTGREHMIYLTDPMIDILRQCPRLRDCDLIFPAQGNLMQPMSGDQKVKDRIAKRVAAEFRKGGVKEPENWCVHDFRRTIATGLQRLGFRPDIADQVIGHVGTTRAGAAAHYLHHRYEEERKEALQVWTEYVIRIVTGNDQRRSKGPHSQRAGTKGPPRR